MEPLLQLRIRNTLGRIVDYLLRQDYVGLEKLTKCARLQARHIASGIVDYGRTLIYPPATAFDDIDVVAIDGKTPPEYSIRFRLFTREEGQSDLELQATFIDEDPSSGYMRVELDGILVP
jgi:hypothetical protein